MLLISLGQMLSGRMDVGQSFILMRCEMTKVHVRLAAKIGDILITAIQGSTSMQSQINDPDNRLSQSSLYMMVSLYNTSYIYGQEPSSQTATFISDGDEWEQVSPHPLPNSISQEIIDVCNLAAATFVNEGKNEIRVPFIDLREYTC